MENHHVYRLPRIWSNEELVQIGSKFTGDICNVSAWKDEDKQGGYYRNYFPNADTYTITNYKSERGYQGIANEIELDLTQPLASNLYSKFNVVFNHTTLEHIFDLHTAFKNLCLLTNDIAIIVVPFLQVLHFAEGFGDYWRFTPMAIQELYRKNDMQVVYHNWNDQPQASVYIISIGSKNPDKWSQIFGEPRQIIYEGVGDKALWKETQTISKLLSSYHRTINNRIKRLLK